MTIHSVNISNIGHEELYSLDVMTFPLIFKMYYQGGVLTHHYCGSAVGGMLTTNLAMPDMFRELTN